jgi:activator of HSP90 ATPase
MKARTTTFKQEVVIPAAPDDVYWALVDPKKHAAVTGARASGEPRKGGEFTAWDGYILGKVLELSKGKKIVWGWSTSEWPEGYPPSKVEITLSRSGDGTKLVMVHSDVPASQAESYRQGWIDFYWEPLKEYFKKRVAQS